MSEDKYKNSKKFKKQLENVIKHLVLDMNVENINYIHSDIYQSPNVYYFLVSFKNGQILQFNIDLDRAKVVKL